MQAIETKVLESNLVKDQKKIFGPKRLASGDIITADIRHDDQCGNGHNSFGVTATIYGKHRIPGEETITFNGKTFWCHGGGCCHNEIAEAFPELKEAIRFHLFSTDGPMHYLANAQYWAGHTGWRDGKQDSPPNIKHLKSTIAWGILEDDTQNLEDLLHSDSKGFTWNEANAEKLNQILKVRLGRLMESFKAEVESLGLKY